MRKPEDDTVYTGKVCAPVMLPLNDLAVLPKSRMDYLATQLPEGIAVPLRAAWERATALLANGQLHDPPRLWTYEEGWQDGKSDKRNGRPPLDDQVMRERGDTYRKGYAFAYSEGKGFSTGMGGTWAHNQAGDPYKMHPKKST